MLGSLLWIVDNFRRRESVGALVTMAVALPLLYSVRQPVALFIPQFLFSTFTAGVGVVLLLLENAKQRKSELRRT